MVWDSLLKPHLRHNHQEEGNGSVEVCVREKREVLACVFFATSTSTKSPCLVRRKVPPFKRGTQTFLCMMVQMKSLELLATKYHTDWIKTKLHCGKQFSFPYQRILRAPSVSEQPFNPSSQDHQSLAPPTTILLHKEKRLACYNRN